MSAPARARRGAHPAVGHGRMGLAVRVTATPASSVASGPGWEEALDKGRTTMNTRSVGVETVTYRIDDIEHASRVFVKTLAQYWAVFNTDQWVSYLMTLAQRIRQQQPRAATLRLEGLEIVFSGFPRPIPVIENGEVIYRAREPRFTLQHTTEYLLPSRRTYLERLTTALAEEMQVVYHLYVDQPPLTLIFPKHEYARQVTAVRAPLLAP